MILDHLVWVTGDLDSAAREWRAAGFDTRPGGRHREQPTRNVLAPLDEGAYLELLGPDDARVMDTLERDATDGVLDAGLRGMGVIPRRFLGLLGRFRGMSDLCFATDALDEVVARARSRGVAVPDPEPMSRILPDGRTISWRLAVPDDPDLPFLVEDVTERSLRVPENAGDTLLSRVCEVSLRVGDPERVGRQVAALLGTSSNRGEIEVGPIRLIVAPTDPSSVSRVHVLMTRQGAVPAVTPDGVTLRRA